MQLGDLSLKGEATPFSLSLPAGCSGVGGLQVKQLQLSNRQEGARVPGTRDLSYLLDRWDWQLREK